MGEFLSISGSLDKNTFSKLKKNKKIKNLEIIYGNIDDEWSLISKLENLRSISIKDSFVDFQSFYKALSNLKKLEKITYNYYCYFNKKPKEKLTNIKITNKIFQIDFPNHKEPDFDFNNFLKETYKNKNNSIFEIRDSEKIFINLEKLIFNNYLSFDNLINSFDYADKKKFNKLLYWEISTSKLPKFKKLKTIEIDQNNKSISFMPRIDHFINNKKIINSLIKINNINYKKVGSLFDSANILDLNWNSSNNKLISYYPNNIDKYQEFIKNNDESLCVSINTHHLYETAYGSNPWKIKNKDKVNKIFNSNIRTIIFSDSNSLFRGFYSSASGKEKIKLLKKLFDNLNEINSIIFDFSKIEKSDITSLNFNFLILLIHELTKKNKNIKIIFFKQESVLLEKLDWPKTHLIYLIRSINKLKEQNGIKINFFNLKDNQINSFYENFIFSKIRNLLVVDNLIFNSSNKFKELDIFYADDNYRGSLYEFEFENSDSLEKKYEFGKLYWDTYYSLNSGYFSNSENELCLVVKKDFIKHLVSKNLNIENIIYSHHPPIEIISEILESEIKVKDKSLKKFNKIKNKEEFLFNKSLSIIKKIESSDQFDFKNNQNKFHDSLKKPDNFDQEFSLLKNLNKIKKIKLEGKYPFYGKYILIDQLDNLVFLENLQELEIDGLIDQRKISFPYFPKLKKIELNFVYNAYNVILENGGYNNSKIEKFSNIPNIESLELRSLYKEYNPKLIKKVGIDRYSEPDRWHNVDVDFSDIHELKKLKEIKIFFVKSKDLNKIKELPSIESLKFDIFQITKEMNPDEGESAYCPIINENTFSFLKNSKLLKKIELVIGSIPAMEDLWGYFLSTRYSGSADFLNHISYNIEELNLEMNVEINKQHIIQDIINNICNRFLKLKKLTLKFGIVINNKTFDWEKFTYKKNILEQNLDIKKFIKLKNLEKLDTYVWSSAIKFRTMNFKEIYNLKKLKDLRWNFETINFNDFKDARINFKNENFENRKDYDYDYDYNCEEDSNYSKNWSRFEYINSDDYGDEWLSLEERFLMLQKKENEKRNKKETIVKKKKN